MAKRQNNECPAGFPKDCIHSFGCEPPRAAPGDCHKTRLTWCSYSPLEQAKTQLSARRWNCSTCGAEYSQEPEIDQHMHERHDNLILASSSCPRDTPV